MTTISAVTVMTTMTATTATTATSRICRSVMAALALTVLLGLGGCAGSSSRGGGHTQCVPFAREVSGIQIRGDAKTWWHQAEGRYDRGTKPRKGAVLALKADSKLPSGHVAVVSAVKNAREIRVDHANWGWNAQTRGRIYRDMPVIDVSDANNWSLVRFKHPDVGDFGRPYPAHGFIYNTLSVAALSTGH